MGRLLARFVCPIALMYMGATGILYFGPVGLIPAGLWVWSRQLERRYA